MAYGSGDWSRRMICVVVLACNAPSAEHLERRSSGDGWRPAEAGASTAAALEQTNEPAATLAAPGDEDSLGVAWQAQVQRRIAATEYALQEDGARFRAFSRSQGWRARFDTRGVQLVGAEGGGAVRIGGSAIARGAGSTPMPEAQLALGGCNGDGELDVDGACIRRLEGARGSVTELWENRADGMEHSFILHARARGSGELSVFVAVEGATVHIEDGGRAARLVPEESGLELRYAKLEVRDAEGRVLPAHMRAQLGGLALVVDDTAATYPILVDPVLTRVAWTVTTDQTGAGFAAAVATAGDVNGDGFDDVIVGAPSYEDGRDRLGRAFAYLGSASGLATTPAWMVQGTAESEFLGSSVASAGDVNGDGFDDVIVGAPFSGRALVYLGSAQGLSAEAAWTANGGQGAGDGFGESVASAGDVNGDGFDDVIVGAPNYLNGASATGAAFIYHGGSNGLGAVPARVLAGNRPASGQGAAVASCNVNGDGFDDVIVGAPAYSNGQANEGAAFIYLGSSAGLAAAPAWSVESNVAGLGFGRSVASAGNVNGDSFADVIVGAGTPTGSGAAPATDRAFVYHGGVPAPATSAAWRVATGAGVKPGTEVAGAGDLNGDGLGDVIVSAYEYENDRPGDIIVSVYLGSPAGLSTTASGTLEGAPSIGGDQLRAGFGLAVARAGDVNGDGLDDMIVGAPGFANGTSAEGTGRAFVYLGPVVPSPWTVLGSQVSGFHGASVAGAGDVNGDGFADVLVGAPLFDNGQTDEGRAFLYLGSRRGPSTVAAWTAESNQAGAQFGASLAGAGDVDGDGFDDVIVGAPRFDNGHTDEGRMFLYRGSSTGLAAAAAATREINQASAHFGESVAGVGDIDGDGFDDVAVGAPLYDNGQADEGRVSVYFGSSAGVFRPTVGHRESNQAGAYFGGSIAGAGDANCDGFADLIVGARLFDDGQTDEGRAFVYFGNATGMSINANWTTDGNQTGAQLGHAVAGANVDAVGCSDLLIGVPRYDAAAVDAGQLRVHFTVSSAIAASAEIIDGAQPNGRLGTSVASAGDLQGDGFDDFIVGEEGYVPPGGAGAGFGRALAYAFGQPPRTFPILRQEWAREGTQPSGFLGRVVAGAGDVNGDGLDDVIIGVPGLSAGRRVDTGSAIVVW